MIPCGPNDDVLEMFAGDGVLFRSCWSRAGKGATCDLEASCVDIAARERKSWTVLQGNAELMLRAGVWSDRDFSIIDIDCFGSPWRFVKRLFSHNRKLKDAFHLVLTDNYMANRNLSHEDLTLEFRKPGSPDDYLRCVDRLMKKLLAPLGREVKERRLFRDGKCVQHLLTLTRCEGTGG